MPARLAGEGVVLVEAPQHLAADAAAVWLEVTSRWGSRASEVVGPELEAYCGQVAILREAHARVAAEGLIVADAKGAPIVHPALAVARQAQSEVRGWGARFSPAVAAKRKPGPMVNATRRAITAASHLAEERYAGVVEATLTLAWLIDEAQRSGLEALQRAAFGTIPSYVKACGELRITPASAGGGPVAVPDVGDEKDEGRPRRLGKLEALRSAAAAAAG